MEFLEEFREFAKSIDGRVWIKNDKKRIYFKVDKTAHAFLNYEYFNPQNPLESSCLKVFSNCEWQGTKWNVNRAKQLKFEIMQRISNATGCEFCDSWREVLL